MTENDLLHAGQVVSGRSSVPLVCLYRAWGTQESYGQILVVVLLLVLGQCVDWSLRLAHMQIFVCGSGKKGLCFAAESKNEK
jgi:hypothetical protein